MAEVRVAIHTDPACPWSWAAEPALRRLAVEFGAGLRFTYVMGGLARAFERPLETMRHWIDAGVASGMPVDPRLWLDAPPASSYPACLAVKAAAEQGLDEPYLRRCREGLAYERRKLDNGPALVDVARQVDGLDVDRFRIDLESGAILEAFGADLDRTRAAAPELRGDHPRVSFPSGHFSGPGGEHWAYDTWDPDEWRAAAVAAGAQPVASGPPTPEAAVRTFGSMATPEVAAVCGMPGPTAPAELWRLAAEWRVRAERLASGEVWRPV
ncbi:MAG TPA: DsbA family protein [Solirubrobacteraceae bacterium]|jgi:predicted DsbA family dithiol-disulfide isomerase